VTEPAQEIALSETAVAVLGKRRMIGKLTGINAGGSTPGSANTVGPILPAP
jgi:hypothetical protein